MKLSVPQKIEVDTSDLGDEIYKEALEIGIESMLNQGKLKINAAGLLAIPKPTSK